MATTSTTTTTTKSTGGSSNSSNNNKSSIALPLSSFSSSSSSPSSTSSPHHQSQLPQFARIEVYDSNNNNKDNRRQSGATTRHHQQQQHDNHASISNASSAHHQQPQQQQQLATTPSAGDYYRNGGGGGGGSHHNNQQNSSFKPTFTSHVQNKTTTTTIDLQLPHHHQQAEQHHHSPIPNTRVAIHRQSSQQSTSTTKPSQAIDHHQLHHHQVASLGGAKQPEEDSNDSDESDTFDGFDDLRDWSKTDGDQVLVPESIDSFFVQNDEGDGDGSGELRPTIEVRLTDRQRKSYESRVSTFSMRMKAKEKKANVRDIFPPPQAQLQQQMKQTYQVNQPSHHDPTIVVEMVDGNSHSNHHNHHHHHQHQHSSSHQQLKPHLAPRPASTVEPIEHQHHQHYQQSPKFARHPQLVAHQSSNLDSSSSTSPASPRKSMMAPIAKNSANSSSSSSNLARSARFQSQPNLLSPDLYPNSNGQHSGGGGGGGPSRIERIKDQSKNIQQKFKNLFSRKQTRKNITITNEPPVLAEQRRRTASSHNFDDDNNNNNNQIVIPSVQQQLPEVATNPLPASPNFHQATRNSAGRKIDTDVERNGVEIKSIKYNASYRKPIKKGADIPRYLLLEPLPLHDVDSLSDYGVIFCVEDNLLKALSLRTNVTHYEDLTKNMTSATAKVALLELSADLKEAIDNHHHHQNHRQSQQFEVKLPRFKDVRKRSNPNVIFGGYLTQLLQLDRKRNCNTHVDCPSVLTHMIKYIANFAIEEEGIFRITGTQNRLNMLKGEITMQYQSYYRLNKPDNWEDIRAIFDKYSPYDVAGLLKLFLRELTKPLFTDELMEVFLMVPSIPKLELQIKILNLLMLLLNEAHRNSLAAILELLHLVVEHQPSNKMSLESICTVMAPNLIVDRTSSTSNNNNNSSTNLLNPGSRRMSMSSQSVNEVSEEMAAYLRRTTNSLAVLKLLINLHPLLFHVPPYIYRQIKNT